MEEIFPLKEKEKEKENKMRFIKNNKPEPVKLHFLGKIVNGYSELPVKVSDQLWALWSRLHANKDLCFIEKEDPSEVANKATPKGAEKEEITEQLPSTEVAEATFPDVEQKEIEPLRRFSGVVSEVERAKEIQDETIFRATVQKGKEIINELCEVLRRDPDTLHVRLEGILKGLRERKSSAALIRYCMDKMKV